MLNGKRHRYPTLLDYFATTGTTQAALARALGVTRQHIHLLARGHAVQSAPSLVLAAKIERLTGASVTAPIIARALGCSRKQAQRFVDEALAA